jgi:putative DNA-invertase from lambdoid prophage Rac
MAVRDALIAFMAATAQAQAEATKSAQRAGVDHKHRAQPNAYLGRKPYYDRASLTAAGLLSTAPARRAYRKRCDGCTANSLSAIAKVEGLSKQAASGLEAGPAGCVAALGAWGM